MTIGILLFVLFAILTTGCTSTESSSSTGMFTFDIPSGFSISNDSDQECDIIDSNGAVVGGIIITDLDVNDITDEESTKLAQYLNSIHEGCEYLSWMGNDAKKPAQYVSEYVNQENTEEAKEYYRVFFERNSCVYDMWFDTDLISQEAIAEFISTIVEK